MLRATEISYSPQAVTDAVIIIKGKERKKKTTSNCQSFRKRFLRISGGLWEAMGSTASAGCSSEEIQFPPSIVPCSCGSEWHQGYRNQHSMGLQMLICFETQAVNRCLGLFPSVFSQKVLAQGRPGWILSRHV